MFEPGQKQRMATKIKKLKAFLKETTAYMLVRYTHTHTTFMYGGTWLCYVRSDIHRYQEERNTFREENSYLKEKYAQLVAQLDGGKYLHHTPTIYHTLLLSSLYFVSYIHMSYYDR